LAPHPGGVAVSYPFMSNRRGAGSAAFGFYQYAILIAVFKELKIGKGSISELAGALSSWVGALFIFYELDFYGSY